MLLTLVRLVTFPGLDTLPGTSLLVLGLAIVVGPSMALLFALSGPWAGALQVSGQPIDTLLRELHAGFFSP